MKRITVACLQVNNHYGGDVISDVIAATRRADALLSPLKAKAAAAAAVVAAGIAGQTPGVATVQQFPASSQLRPSKFYEHVRSERRPDVLVLPELAFTGYGFPSKAAIWPFLEPTASGISTRWAQRTAKELSCNVIVGYPELAKTANQSGMVYNSAVVVAPSGAVIYNYRKHFLFEADEKWGARPGPDGFGSVELQTQANEKIKVALGICMDLNPEKFQAPFDKFEFANFAIGKDADLIVMPMAWLCSRQPAQQEVNKHALGGLDVVDDDLKLGPDSSTVQYWARRLSPVRDLYLNDPPKRDRPAGFVVANRSGIENKTDGTAVRYAGSSTTMKFEAGGRITALDVLPCDQEGLSVVDINI
ncbi:carbon-nitrogen hydrolase [Lipomyces japonicus]|uniref:carbon-nitrogen hydrolase n=1 Tax=Lipomyces japonicus TaxID=56871 RepID=UPI0034CF68A4